ncbi:MAG TPA: RHS repeat-associated core domain-containing protein [Blastocatellia bacterium]|nr:RHS repeat-associated core domain-containing protein [Blastocatellia bacterium]
MFYNSQVWSRRGNNLAYDAITSWPSPGFSIGYGQIIYYDVQTSPGPSTTAKFMLIQPDGTRCYLGSGPIDNVAPHHGFVLLTSTDGSHITYHGTTSGGTLYYPDGTRAEVQSVNNRLVPTRISDTNGNYIQIAYKQFYCDQNNNCYGAYPYDFPALSIDYITDSVGRVIQFNYDSNNNLTSISKPAFGGTSQNPLTETLAYFYYEDKTFSNNFSGLTVERASGATRVLRRVYFPATATGYLFTHSDFGMVHTYSMRRQMTTTSDGVDSATVAFNYPTSGGTALTDAPAFTQRTESAVSSPTSTFTYSTGTDSVAQTKTFTITRPDSTAILLTRSTDASSLAKGRLVQTEVKNGTVSASKGVTTYANDPSGTPQVQSVISYDDAGNPSKVEYGYDQYGNATNIREYGNQISGNWQVRRRVRLTYKTDTAYINAYLRGLVTLSETLDAKNNTNDSDDEVIAKTATVYDDYTAMGGMESYTGFSSPPGHISGYNSSLTVRGNVTGTTQWTDVAANTSITRLVKYDIFGNVVKMQVSCCQEKDFTFEESLYWSLPEEVMSGDPSGTHLTDLYQYDFNTGALTSQTDPADQVVEIFYDAAMRPDEVELGTGLVRAMQYDDANLSYSETVTSNAGTWTSSATKDGWGRTITSVGTNGSQVNTSYDAMGRVSGVTNPFASGGQAGPSTSYQYDTLGRVTVTTLPDNNTIINSYSGRFSTVTDPVGRVMMQETDGLGRLAIATEQASNGTLNQQTAYSYNLLDKLVEVDQGGQLRKFKYDALGRLLFERIPEQQATINDGTGQMWTTKYTYTNFSAVATKQDARGVVTTYQYNSLHHLTDIDYNTTNAAGVAATDSVDYLYNSDGLLDHVTVGQSRYVETYAYDAYARVSSITRAFPNVNAAARSYVSSYQYNEANQVTQVTYPSGHSHGIGYDTKGRLASVGSYLRDMTYNPSGQVDSLKTGPSTPTNQVVTEAYAYNDRSQMISQTATRNGAQLMNLSYDFQAAAGAMGAGTSAGNGGQLVGISGSIDGQTESATFKYDLQRRLVTSSQTTGGQSYQRRFEYDRWGNRTAMYDAVTGGTQIQSIALQQSSSVPTNRVQSVTQGASTANYTYDAAGNVTNDGSHSYKYDAENRLVAVDNGATASYEYDHQNRRIIKTIGSARTDYVWDGSKVISEHDGSAGGWSAKVNYIYLGNRLIATLNFTLTPQCTTDSKGVVTCTNSLTSTATRFYLSDQSSTRAVLDSNGNVVGRQAHLPYGEEIATSGLQEKHRFTTYDRDGETSTDYAVNRQYSYGTGRFNRPDPHRYNLSDPQSLNRYTYVENDPVNQSDPLGLFIVPVFSEDDLAGTDCTLKNTYFWHGEWYLECPDESREPLGEDIVVPSPPQPEPCDITLPTDPNMLAGFITVLGEASSSEKEGTRQYKDGDRFGNPTGQIITEEILLNEALMIASVIINRARRDNESYEQVVTKKKQFIGYQGGKKLLEQGKRSAKGSPLCEKMKRALAAFDTIHRLGPSIDNVYEFRAVVQPGNFVRPQNGAVRVAGTDFF